MMITTVQLRKIIAAGGGVVVDGSRTTMQQLKEIATEAVKSNVKITIRNATNITSHHLEQLASMAPGLITFALTLNATQAAASVPAAPGGEENPSSSV